MRRHLADDPSVVTWLYPDDGGFTPESLPETAFRPLRDWIDYVLEHDHEALQAWVESARFEFESFVWPRLEGQLVVESDGLEDRRDFVIAVGAASAHAQAEVNLGEGRERDFFFRHVRAAGSFFSKAPAAVILPRTRSLGR